MQLYFHKLSVFRPYALGICAIAAGTSVTLLIHSTDWKMAWYWYIALGVLVWVVYSSAVFLLFGPVNGLLIKVFGSEHLAKEQLAFALEIVTALFDRRSSIDFPDQDDDLVKREAALTFKKYFEE